MSRCQSLLHEEAH
uniref:Uncharacterized protein n=1 Tax=Anguilla anguilla TaxID=7936 RepID=A0A0E9V1X7_ANGAN